MKKDTSWGKVADWYHNHLSDKDSYHSQVITPNLLRVMDVSAADTVLDLACGTGFLSEVFHSRHAKVIGVDIGAELIDLAREHASKDITFFVSPSHKLSFIKTGSITKIAVVLAIQNIREVRETLEECKRVLVPGGSLFIVMNHPAFRIPGGSSWEWDSKTNRQYRRIEQYLSEKTVEIAMHPGREPSEKTVSFHRSLQFYMKHARGAGFALTRLEEWISHKTSGFGPRQKEEDRIRKEIPLFMMLELTSSSLYNLGTTN